MRILIADDEAYICEQLLSILHSLPLPHGSSIAAANNGMHALQLALNQIPDLLICDIRMPGLSGIELAEQIQSLNKHCAVIILTHYSDQDYLRSAIALHVKAYFDKPIHTELLAQAVHEIICEHSQRQKQMEIYNDALASITEMIKKLWCQELFKKDPSFDFLVERCHQYHFNELIDAPFRCVFIRKALSQSILANHLPQGMHLLSRGPADTGSIYCFLYASTADGVSDQAVRSWFEILKKHGLADGLAVGNTVVSRIHGYSSYEHAQQAADQLFFSDEEKIVFWKPASVCKSFSFSDQMFKSLQNHLMGLAFRSARDQLQMLFTELEECSDTPLREIHEFFHRIADLFLHASVVNQLCFHEQHENTALYRDILLADRFSALKNLVEGWFGELADFGEGDTRVIRSITACIRRNYTNPFFGNADICAYTGYSMSYLCTMFKRNMGVTLNYYITQVRMEHACRLLAQTDEPIEKIAIEVGYTGAKHFSRSFKNHLLLTPGQYRKQMADYQDDV